eukprot:CCRYP_005981-RA/>CCRYP_005981-RA protein AED:0.34 eAED:0.34 QI:108/1/1/1/0/0/2/3/47
MHFNHRNLIHFVEHVGKELSSRCRREKHDEFVVFWVLNMDNIFNDVD